jgi:hypothetical protein
MWGMLVMHVQSRSTYSITRACSQRIRYAFTVSTSSSFVTHYRAESAIRNAIKRIQQSYESPDPRFFHMPAGLRMSGFIALVLSSPQLNFCQELKPVSSQHMQASPAARIGRSCSDYQTFDASRLRESFWDHNITAAHR